MNKLLDKTIRYIKSKTRLKPEIGLIMGSGLGSSVGDVMTDVISIEYSSIPHFITSSVCGHNNQLLVGKIAGKAVLVMSGRFHYYEGYDLKNITYPVRVMGKMGVRTLIVTNASGAVNKTFSAGEFMVISDHINFMGNNPLIGDCSRQHDFLDMSVSYDSDLISLAVKCACTLKIRVHKGVYMAVAGPLYETPAEVKMARSIGADVIGMSTVPEVIVARDEGMRVLGISCIVNRAGDLNKDTLSHVEVLRLAGKMNKKLIGLIKNIILK